MAENRVAIGVADADLASYQRAVRSLLTRPLLTESVAPEELERVRRWAPHLSRDLESLAGYRLELCHSAARLLRRRDRLDATQPAETNAGRPFDRRRYAYLCLSLAALARAGGQITLSELSDHLRSMAAEVVGLGFDPDVFPQRLAFVDAIQYLERLGAIRATDGSTLSWQRDPGEADALYDIDRDVCQLLFAPTRVLQHVHSVGDLLETTLPLGRDARRLATRQRMVRLLLEYPVLYYDDLDEGERRYLHAEARELAADLMRFTGAALERRGEGLALIDVAASFSDLRFPGSGTPAHVALLLIDRIATLVIGRDPTMTLMSAPSAFEGQRRCRESVDLAMPATGRIEGLGQLDSPEELLMDPAAAEHARASTVPLFTEEHIAALVGEIVSAFGEVLAREYRESPKLLAAEALRLMASFDLIRRVPGGYVPRPAMARYRNAVVTAAPSAEIDVNA